MMAREKKTLLMSGSPCGISFETNYQLPVKNKSQVEPITFSTTTKIPFVVIQHSFWKLVGKFFAGVHGKSSGKAHSTSSLFILMFLFVYCFSFFCLFVINHFNVKKTCCEMRLSLTWRHFLCLRVKNFHLLHLTAKLSGCFMAKS